MEDLGILSMFHRTEAPQKGGPTGQKISDSSATYSGLSLCGASFWRFGTFKSSLNAARLSLANKRLPNSESRISNHVIAATAYGCNAEFMVNFCTLISENL